MHQLSPMVRSALFVADLKKSEQFYRNVLGLVDVWYEGAQ